MAINNENPKILIVSDVHLGASGSKYKKFSELLNKIKEGKEDTKGKWKDLEVLLILGDFFDLCMETYDRLNKKDYRDKIYSVLDDLKKHRKIEIVVVLGNHDIPIDKTYPSKGIDRFKYYKNTFFKKFKKEFQKNNSQPEFFDENKFCQYVILKEAKNGAELLLFDSKKDLKQVVKKNYKECNKRKISISEMNLKHKKMFLFAHGYQFDNNSVIKVARPLWKRLIETDGRFLKRLLNCLYNKTFKQSIKEVPSDQDLLAQIKEELMREGFTEEDLDDTIINNEILEVHKLKDEQYLSKKEDRENNLEVPKFPESKILGLTLKTTETTYDRIRKFLTYTKLDEVENVIFGHTHEIKQEFEKVSKNIKGIEFINDGAWQHNDVLTYVTILSDGYTQYDLY